MFMTSASGAVRKGMTSLYLNSSVEWMRKKTLSALLLCITCTCGRKLARAGWEKCHRVEVKLLAPLWLERRDIVSILFQLFCHRVECVRVRVCGGENMRMCYKRGGVEGGQILEGKIQHCLICNYRTIPKFLESDPSGVCFPLRLPLLIFNNQSKSLTQIHCGWMTPCPPWKVQKEVKIRGEWEVLEQKREPWEVPSNGKSPGERIKCFRMLQVLNGASNLPPDAFQSHKHTYMHTHSCQISSEREERERAVHSGRRTECVRKNSKRKHRERGTERETMSERESSEVAYGEQRHF